jgi:nitrate reductase cytochrome c-type subunit
MKKALLIVMSVALSWSCASGSPPSAPNETPTPPSPAAPAGISDAEIGLAPGTAFEQPEQQPITFNAVDPGESELHPRPNADFPPVIPHSIAGLETITLSENPCLDCHHPEMAPDMGAPAVPASHQVDLRNSPDVADKDVAGARWVCTSCHVAQTDTAPLVANRATD